MKNKWYRNFRYDLPMHFVMLLLNWLPDNIFILRLRGFLVRPFLGKCGKNLRLGRNVVFYNPSNIHIGNDVYIAYGCWFSAIDTITINDEVMIGPYCIFASSNHTRRDKSYRYGQPKKEPINIETGCWVGGQCSILAGTQMEAGALLAANSVAKGHIEGNAMYAGCPAVKVKAL